MFIKAAVIYINYPYTDKSTVFILGFSGIEFNKIISSHVPAIILDRAAYHATKKLKMKLLLSGTICSDFTYDARFCRLYYMQLLVGNPARPYFLDIDTGSDLTWLQCNAPCSNCPEVRPNIRASEHPRKLQDVGCDCI